MAQVYVTRGDLDRALGLYQESLQLLEQIGDLQGKAASLSGVANLHMVRQDWPKAEQCILESMALAGRLGQTDAIAFNTVKLGQIAQARGDAAAALARYREGLVVFERLGMPRETEQVRHMIASLEGGGEVIPSDPLSRLIARARAAGQAGDAAGAAAAQEEAVALARQAGEEREALVTLSVLLYNLAGYYQRAGRHDDAVAALEEVVALDERTGHSDLESDRETLERARQLARLSPDERARLEAASAGQDAALPHILSALDEQLARLPPDERAQLEARLRQLAGEWEGMSPEEQAQQLAAMLAGGQRQQIESFAAQAREGAIAALRGEIERGPLLERIEQVAAQAAEGEEPGSPRDDLAAYLRAVVALLRGQPVPPVPASYAAHLAAIQDAMVET
ncbi:MAG TPA: tetratricopeptide repeat protein, partial [Anaerolineae bacterium]|nr:tetratricopeptide repeat protein [Anaerolineae bacterium]